LYLKCITINSITKHEINNFIESCVYIYVEEPVDKNVQEKHTSDFYEPSRLNKKKKNNKKIKKITIY